MYYVVSVAILGCLVSLSLCNEFKSVPTTVKTHQNDTVLLPCYLDRTGSEETGGEPESIRWFKNGEQVADSADPEQSTASERIKLWQNGSLEVSNIQDPDTGEYMCEVIRKPPWSSIKQLHAIEVLYPPSIESTPSSGFLQVELGGEVQMSCTTNGVPHPLMTWTSKGVEMQLLDNRHSLSFPATDRHLSGVYECVASNGVGSPARTQIALNIIYPPEATTEKMWVHASPGLRATLDCTVFADPQPIVKWFKSNMSVALDSRVISLVDGEKHVLLIRNVRISDFGIYTCRAINDLGIAEVDIQLSGVANPGVFKEIEQKFAGLRHAFTLVWEVDSYTPIIEYNLWFRAFQTYNILRKSDWTKLTIPAEHNTGPMHSKAYEVTGLKENTVYEAMLLSRNRYGWSKPSKLLRFSIDGTELKEEVVTQLNIQENIIPVDIMPVPVLSHGVTHMPTNFLFFITLFMYLLIRN